MIDAKRSETRSFRTRFALQVRGYNGPGVVPPELAVQRLLSVPPEYGGRELKLAALSFAYHGSSDRLVVILRKEFPEVLAGLNTSKVDRFRRGRTSKMAGQSGRGRKQEAAVGYAS
jgi:hypothetical protein